MASMISQTYEDKVDSGLIRADAAQRAILPLLDDLRQRLEAAAAPRGRALVGLLTRRPLHEAPKGLYLWGDVGRGKSMLVDLFFDSVATLAKRRVHFHAYLLELHAAIHAEQRAGSKDPIPAALAKVGQGLALLVLDEMDVSDIGDAMILDRVFRQLLDQGVCIVTTSNRAPGQLYRDGLKRDLFIPFVSLLETRLEVAELVGPNDWRRAGQTGQQVFFLSDESGFDHLWHQFAPGPVSPLTLTLFGRQIVLPEAAQGCARARFADLCATSLGPADLGRIARSVSVLFLDGVPVLDAAAQDEIRRFVTLIDEVYEARTGLVMRCDGPPDDLIAADMQSEGTRRLVSRLAQIQSQTWVDRFVLPNLIQR